MGAPNTTPGPWGYTWSEGEVEIFDGTSESPGCDELYIYASGESLICSLDDTRLIASAPELYEALEEALAWAEEERRWANDSDLTRWFNRCEFLTAALARARGEQS